MDLHKTVEKKTINVKLFVNSVKDAIILVGLVLCCDVSYGNVHGIDTMNKTNPNHWAFEENKGQVLGRDSAKVRFYYKQSPLTVFLRNTGLTYQFTQFHRSRENEDRLYDGHSLETENKELPLNKIETYRMDMELVGANPHAEVIKEQASEDYIHYYNHNALDIRSYQKIIYKNVYEGIDWVVYLTPTLSKIEGDYAKEIPKQSRCISGRNDGVLKYDFIVHPGVDPSQIKMKVKWAEDLKLDEQGNLVMKNRMGEVKEEAPTSFQEQSLVHSKFRLVDSVLSFDLGVYDKAKTLIIDPSLAWFTYYGADLRTVSNSTCIDSNGNI